MSGLDEHERRILRCIERYQNRFGRTPSYEEIRVLTGMSSKDHVYRDVKALEQMGYLQCEPSISRGITLLRSADGYHITPHSVSIPVLGHASAGEPIPLVDDGNTPLDWIEMARSMLPDSEGVFAVRVRGNSMIDALVNDGDTVVMTKQETARNGELVAVRIKNDPTNPGITLKRFFRRNGHVWLKPENQELRAKKYAAGDVHIEGKVLCVIRNIPASKAPKREIRD
jgi:repressor LexA